MVLTVFPHDPLLDLDPWVGQRQATYRFTVSNGVTGEHLGDITPIRTARLSHDTSRTTKRTLNLDLGVADQAAINTVTDRINVYMVFPNGTEYPLGRYMFTDNTRAEFTSGEIGSPALSDEMFLVDQQITAGINGFGQAVSTVIQDALAGLPIDFNIEPAGFMSAESWGIGASRGSVLEALAVSGDYFSPWFDNNGVLRFIRTFNPAERIPDLDFDSGNQVMRANIMKNDDLLTAPNVFVIISNAATNNDTEVVGTAAVPPTAPHSATNRGFVIAEVQDLQLSDGVQAQAVAQGLVNRQTLYEKVSLSTAPDPRFDSYNVVYWQGSFWLDLAWGLPLVEGAAMNHVMRRAYRG